MHRLCFSSSTNKTAPCFILPNTKRKKSLPALVIKSKNSTVLYKLIVAKAPPFSPQRTLIGLFILGQDNLDWKLILKKHLQDSSSFNEWIHFLFCGATDLFQRCKIILSNMVRVYLAPPLQPQRTWLVQSCSEQEKRLRLEVIIVKKKSSVVKTLCCSSSFDGWIHFLFCDATDLLCGLLFLLSYSR